LALFNTVLNLRVPYKTQNLPSDYHLLKKTSDPWSKFCTSTTRGSAISGHIVSRTCEVLGKRLQVSLFDVLYGPTQFSNYALCMAKSDPILMNYKLLTHVKYLLVYNCFIFQFKTWIFVSTEFTFACTCGKIEEGIIFLKLKSEVHGYDFLHPRYGARNIYSL
jgi:hypothetical protein